MKDQDGHRAFTAERKANLIKLTEALRNSDSLLTQFVANPNQVATTYGIKVTEEEATALAAIAGNQELDEQALAAAAGGVGAPDATSDNSGCSNTVC